MRVRLKSPVVEAIQYRDKMLQEDNLPPHVFVMPWMSQGMRPTINTWFGQAMVEDGDWIVPDLDGVHHHRFKPKDFAKHYEPVEDEFVI